MIDSSTELADSLGGNILLHLFVDIYIIHIYIINNKIDIFSCIINRRKIAKRTLYLFVRNEFNINI